MPVATLLLNPPALEALPDAAGIARMQGDPGAYLDLAHLLGLRPDLYTALGQAYDAVFRNPESQLSEEERDLSALLVALLSCSKYPERLHRARLAALDIPAEVMAALDSRELNDPALSHRQRAYLNFVRKMTAFPHTIVDKDMEYLAREGFSEGAILELGVLAAVVQMFGRLADAYNVGV